ncbi:MAG: amidohydrolase, partial [Pseudomonadota bacterium]
MKKLLLPLLLALPAASVIAADAALTAAVAQDYSSHLAPLYAHFHAHPELSLMETQTAARLAQELRAAGFEVTEGVGKTGVVAILKNGPGPLVLMRSDIDALPVEEPAGNPNASKVRMKDWAGKEVPVMHACGHDVHMTSLVGTAHQMAARRKEWSGTLMLIGQPAEERVAGAKAMMKDNLYQRFGKPDYALAMHVISDLEAGRLAVDDSSMFSGVDSLEITIHGLGAHGSAPHTGKDPVVLGAQIVLALQTIISRDLAPREPRLITVGAFHAGSKGNIIPDTAVLQLTVRSESAKAREQLLAAISRVTLNTARAAGIAENMLPEIKQVDEPSAPTLNTPKLAQRLRAVWNSKMAPGTVDGEYWRSAMVAEDFGAFTDGIPSTYFIIGGSSGEKVAVARNGGP